jgi:hypothetical protein
VTKAPLVGDGGTMDAAADKMLEKVGPVSRS